MKTCCAFSVLLFSGLVLAACTPAEQVAETPGQEVSTEAAVEAIDSLGQKYMDASRSEDATALVDLFTADALRMPPNEPSSKGSEALRDYFAEAFEHESLDVTVKTDELQVLGDWAFTCGTYSVVAKDKATEEVTEDNGKWINILKREPDGSWKIHRNIWNSDDPIPEASEE